MQTFERMPFAAQKAVFDKLGSIAEIAAMPTEQRYRYEQSLKEYRDAYNTLQSAIEDGIAKGRAEGRLTTIERLRNKYRSMGLSEQEISALLDD